MIFPISVKFETSSLEDAFSQSIKGPLDTDIIQRKYVWSEQNNKLNRVDRFIEDFLILARDPSSTDNNSIGQVVFFGDKTNNTFSILDGLQRITTLFVFIRCIFEEINKHKNTTIFNNNDDWKDFIEDFKSLHKLINTRFKLHNLPKQFLLDNKQNLITARKIILENHEFKNYFNNENINKKERFSSVVRNIFTVILKSKMSYCCVDDRPTAYKFFELLNSGVPLEAYEFLKVKISSCPGYSTRTFNAITALNTLFLSNNGVDTELIQCCLGSFEKELYEGENKKQFPTDLKTTILMDSFSSHTLELKNYQKNKNFLTHSLSVKTRIEEVKEYFNTNYNISDIFNKVTKKIIAFSCKDPNYKINEANYMALFLLIDVLIAMPKQGIVNSGHEWFEVLTNIRRILISTGTISINNIETEIKSVYSRIFRSCLIDINNNPRNDFLEQRYGNSQIKKLKRIFLLIETALNGGTLPNTGIYEVEHIKPQSKLGSNLIGNLCLLEKNINENLNKDWTMKYTPGINTYHTYQESNLWLPKMVFGYFSKEFTHPNIHYYQANTLQFITDTVSTGKILNIDDRVLGNVQHMAALLDFAIQRLLKGI